MKKLLVLLIIVVSSGTIFAQPERGKLVVSGSSALIFTSGTDKYIYDGITDYEYKSTTLSFTPSVAFFVINNLAVGLSSNISTSSLKNEDGDKYVTNSIAILPTVLFYIPIQGKIRPLAQFAVGLYSSSTNDIPKTGTNDKTSQIGLAINFGGGASFFIKENISLNLGLSYTFINLTDGDDSKSKEKQGNFGSNIGFSIFF